MIRKKYIKNLMPPILFKKIDDLRIYYNFIKYKDLIKKNAELKNIHNGKRCFILGSSPSIKNENLKPLKYEIVFALNNFYVHDDFNEIMSGNVTKYYMTAPIHRPQTEKEWKKWFEDMEANMPTNAVMIFGLNSYKENIKYILDKYKLFQKHHKYWFFAGKKISKDSYFKERDIDFSKPVWSAQTVSTYALILAIYMGFKEIYLVGIDHNYVCLNEDNYRFYKTSIHQRDEHKRMNFKKSDEFFSTGQVFLEKEIIAENCKKIKIFNCSKNSLLDMFDKIELNEVLNEKNKTDA